jgi:hypothetical protein
MELIRHHWRVTVPVAVVLALSTAFGQLLAPPSPRQAFHEPVAVAACAAPVPAAHGVAMGQAGALVADLLQGVLSAAWLQELIWIVVNVLGAGCRVCL